MYLVPKSDRLVVVFAMEFPNKTDRVIANVLLGVRFRFSSMFFLCVFFVFYRFDYEGRFWQ